MAQQKGLSNADAAQTLHPIQQASMTSGPSAHLCRCGNYTAIIQAAQRAGAAIAKAR
jgi:aerobic-type carbon monoxide dehydrogenase small subunit (CoxS/CutS family)